MKTTINLRFEKSTIEAAKKYALKKNTSVSAIVEAYLKRITSNRSKKEFASDKLIGIIKQKRKLTDDELRERYLKGKHDA